MAKSSAVMQLRVDDRLKSDFAVAARAQNATPSQALRALMADYIRQSQRREAERQFMSFAAAPDADETMNDVASVQEWLFD